MLRSLLLLASLARGAGEGLSSVGATAAAAAAVAAQAAQGGVAQGGASVLAHDVTDVAQDAAVLASDSASGGAAAAPAAAVSAQRQAYLSAAELGMSATSSKHKVPSKRVGYLEMQGELNDPLAVCNDGSPGTYYFRKGTDPSNWLVYLEGGMWCYSAATCSVRNQSTPWEMSSLHLAPQVALGGIFETSKKNPWAAANVAYVPYCSSDAWVGDAGASEATFGWHFRGQRILAAVLASLVQTQGLGSHTGLGVAAEAQRLLLAGCSAGARGAMMNLDYVSGILADVGVTSEQVAVQGLLDSPLWVDMEPASPHIVPLANETRAVFGFVNATARLGPGCAAAYPAEEDQKCLFGQYRMPLLETPYMLNAAQDDKFELPYNLGGTTAVGYDVQSWHPDQMAYAQAFGPQVLAVVNTLPAAAQKKSAVFSAACFRHCVSDSAAFWNVAIAQPPPAGGRRRGAPEAPISLAQAASAWYFGRVSQPYRVVQQCTGFRCGQCSTKLAKAMEKDGSVHSVFDSGVAAGGSGRVRAALLTAVLLTLCGTCVLLSCAGSSATQQVAHGAMAESGRRRAEPPPGFRPILGFKKKSSGVMRPGVRYGDRSTERSPLLD